VKVIVVEKENGTTQYFAKTKGPVLDATPHFEVNKSILRVHEDSGSYFRVMDPVQYIGSGSLQAGINFGWRKGLGVAILPMKETANGFTADFGQTEWYPTLPDDEWCLMASGSWGLWRKKASRSSASP